MRRRLLHHHNRTRMIRFLSQMRHACMNSIQMLLSHSPQQYQTLAFDSSARALEPIGACPDQHTPQHCSCQD